MNDQVQAGFQRRLSRIEADNAHLRRHNIKLVNENMTAWEIRRSRDEIIVEREELLAQNDRLMDTIADLRGTIAMLRGSLGARVHD